MIKYFIYILTYLFLIVNSAYAEIKVIDLSSKNPSGDNNIFKEEKKSEEIDNNSENDQELFTEETINENDEDLININQNEIENNLNEVADVWKNSSKKNIEFLLEKFNHNINSKTIIFSRKHSLKNKRQHRFHAIFFEK